MKRLIITGLVMASMVSQSMATTTQDDLYKLGEHLSSSMGVSRQQSKSLIDESIAFYGGMTSFKRKHCENKILMFNGEELVFVNSFRNGMITSARQSLMYLERQARALYQEGCIPDCLRPILDSDVTKFEQILQQYDDFNSTFFND